MEWEMAGVIVPTVFWIFVGAVVLVPVYLKFRDRKVFYDTIRAAYETGHPVAPELVAAMRAAAPADAGLPPAERDLRTGVILLAAGLGMCGLGFGLWYGLMPIDDLSAWTTGGWVGGIGSILSIVGLVYLLFWLTRRGR